jgi:hypothetical protein
MTMRKTKLPIIATVIIGLLAGSAVGVAAQDEATAVEFTGAIGFGPDVKPIVEPFTDPRLAGEFRVWTNSDAYPGGPTIFTGGFSMHDDEGGWIQRVFPGGAINHPDGTSAPRVIVMDGQGAYAGLTLVAAVSLANRRWDWHGYIIDGELPPAPTIELPE